MNTRKKTRLCQHCGGVNPLAVTDCAYCSAALVGHEEQDSSQIQSAIPVDVEPLDAKVLEASLYEAPPKFSSHEASGAKAWVVGEDPLNSIDTESLSQSSRSETSQKAREPVIPSSKVDKPALEEDLFASIETQGKGTRSGQEPHSTPHSSTPSAKKHNSQQQELPGMPSGLSDQSQQLPPLSSANFSQEVTQALSEGENSQLLSRHEGFIFDESALSKKPADLPKQKPASPIAAEGELRPIYSVFDQPEAEKMGRLQQQVAKNESLIGSTYSHREKESAFSIKMLSDGARALLTGERGVLTLLGKTKQRLFSLGASLSNAILSGWTLGGQSVGGTGPSSSSQYWAVATLGLSLFGQLALLWAALLIFFSRDGQFTLSWPATTWPLFFAIGVGAIWFSLRIQRGRAGNTL